jgi:hypothetical protein
MVRRDIHFAADDGLNTVGSGLMIEIRGGEKISVVGYGDGGHPAARGFGGKFADFASAVQKRVIRVQMKVNKVRGIHAKFILNQLAAARNTNLRLYFFPQGCGSAPVKSRSLSASGARQTAVRRKKRGTRFGMTGGSLFSAEREAAPDESKHFALGRRGSVLAA